MLYFITGNRNKFEEVAAVLGNVRQLEMDLTEIQELDARKVVKAKLLEALKHMDGEFIVEDTSLYLECLKGLPGPLIKWFMESIGNQGIYDIAEKLGNRNAEARTIIGYARNSNEIYLFEGRVKGKIVHPGGSNGFGWDSIFVPKGFEKRFSEMDVAEKNRISMRRLALDKLKAFLEKDSIRR